MNKEGHFFRNFNYTDDYFKTNSKRRKLITLGSKRIPITRSNFLDLLHYNKTINECDKDYPHQTHQFGHYYNHYIQWLYKNNYHVHFLIWNKKQVIDLFRVYEEYDIHFPHADI